MREVKTALALPTRACLKPLFLGDRLHLKPMSKKDGLGFGVSGGDMP